MAEGAVGIISDSEIKREVSHLFFRIELLYIILYVFTLLESSL